MPLNGVGDNIWELQGPMRLLGVEFGHRMTVVRLSSGDLWVHSPVALDTSVRKDIEKLGTPRYFVAPNTFHDMYWPPYFETYGEAEFWGALGMPKSLPFRQTLGEETPLAWQADLELVPIAGMPRINESVFFHKPSRTLIVADLVFNLGRGAGLFSSVMLKVMGAYDVITASRLFRAYIKDKQAMRESLDRIFALDFDRVIVGHGANVMTDGKTTLEQAYAFL